MKSQNMESVAAPEPTLERRTPPLEQGLTSYEVQERLQKGFDNRPVEDSTNTVGQIIKSNILTFFNLLFFLLAICIILVGSYSNLMFMPVVLINIVIGIIQEIRAKRVIDKLSVLSAPDASVVRDGVLQRIPTAELVIDDIVHFNAGNQIPADAVVLAGQVQVNESLITGESDEVTKNSGDSLFSGSFVVSGSCAAVLDKVGADSFASRLTLEAKKKKKRVRSEMMKSLNSLIKCIGFLIVPLGIIMFYRAHYVLGNDLQNSVVTTVAALVGMIPEGLYLLTSVALAVSVIRLARKKTLVHEMGCIEALARVDVLCVDKTGTVTEPTMRVTDLNLIDEQQTEGEIRHLLASITGSLNADNATMEALKTEFALPSPRRPVRIIPFSSALKYSGASFDGNTTYLVGAPEFIMPQIDFELAEKINALAAEGKRVLLLASCSGIPNQIRIPDAFPIALIALTNPIRREAKRTFRYFADQGVKIKVISGDNPLTVSRVATGAGIRDAENYVDASTLLDDTALYEAAEKYTVFGRVTPDQKRSLVRALKDCGHTVAMTGDGVNDVLALKDADCSIAMASGSDAACQIAQLVLLDSNFASMPSVVDEGRRVVNNIERAASLFLVKNIFSFMVALIAIFAPLTYPLTPLQLSLISTLTIGIPSFFLALEPNTNLVKGHFLKNVLFRAMPAGLTNLFLILGSLAFAYVFSIDMAEASTVCVILMGYVGFLMLFRVCSPFNLKRKVLYSLLSAVFLVLLFGFGNLFDLVPLSAGSLLVLAVFVLLAIPTIRTITSYMNHLANFWNQKVLPLIHRLVRKWKE